MDEETLLDVKSGVQVTLTCAAMVVLLMITCQPPAAAAPLPSRGTGVTAACTADATGWTCHLPRATRH